MLPLRPETDDLRESPLLIILAEALLGKGHQLRIYDTNVSVARLVGANITQQIPHLSSLLCDKIEEVLEESDVIVVGNASSEFGDALRSTRPEQQAIDIVG